MDGWFQDIAALVPSLSVVELSTHPYAVLVYGSLITPVVLYNVYRLIFTIKVVKEGERAVVYNHRGEGRLVVGPKRLALFRERLQRLAHYCADQFQYLRVTDVDGEVSHHRGPCELYNDPLKYQSIQLKNAVKLDANHMIVVYNKLENEVQRRTIQGPTVFVPTADEWLHEFVWHGPDPLTQRRLLPEQFKSTEVATIPENFYYNITEVRTTDDTMITVQLMIFYQLTDVLTMLNKSHDPIADMKNALCSDVIAFAGKLTFEQFLEKIHELSSLKTYPTLMHGMGRIGFDVQKVVYRGYHANDQLQLIQNAAIESRTQLRLNAEIEDMDQKLTDLKLARQQARTEIKHRVDNNKQEHCQMVDKVTQKHALEQKEMEHKQSLIIEAKKAKVYIDQNAAEDQQNEKYLLMLKELGVDLTKYLTELNVPPNMERIEVS